MSIGRIMDNERPAKGSASDKQLLKDLRKRFQDALDADEEQRRDGIDDMKFATVPGYQWDENQKKERGRRPCYEFNKIRVTGKRVINNMRDNRPAGKVRGVEDNDKDNAEVYEGLIRNIWARNGDHVMDYAAEYQVFAGYGAWRIETDFSNDDMFEQDIEMGNIPNPFCLFSDPASRDVLKRDARYWILTEKIPNDQYETKYPKAEIVNFDSHEFDDEEDWSSDEETRIAEYWYKMPAERELWELDGETVIKSDSDEAGAIDPARITKRRTVKYDKIMMCIASGESILEGPTEWAGSMFPFVPVYGEYYIIDGKTYWNGITRFAKDAQRSYNVSRTAIAESIAMAPQSKFWATAAQAEGHDKQWKVAHQKNYPFMLYNADPITPGPPTRMGGADIPVALIQESQLAAEEINMVTGIYQGDIGAPNQATSGKQEIARQQAGAIATFNYSDNMAKAIERTWELLIDLIPNVYNTKRSLRVLGADGSEKYVKINEIVPSPETGEPITVHDLSMGKYDTVVTVGPNFTTRRQEAAETYQGLLQGNPDLFPIIGDLIFKSMDLPYAEDISDRMQIMLPPEIQKTLGDENQDIPPEVQQMMQQAQQGMQMVEEQMQQVQEAGTQIQLDAQNNETAKAEVKTLIAQLETKQAEFKAEIAQQLAGVTHKEAQFTIKEVEQTRDGVIEESRQVAEDNSAQFNQALASDVAQSMQAIGQLVEEFNTHAVAVMSEIKEKEYAKPRIKEVTSKRVNGQLVAIPVYEDDETHH
jgi:hypothetical protein